MDGIFFLILAFLTAFISIKLSYYGDLLSKQTKLASAFIGGLIIASITSLPEFVTSISAVIIDNPALSFGDILGSNMFNIFVLSIYNLYFFKKNIFNNKNKYIFECLILILEYIFIWLNLKFITTLILILLYLIYSIKTIKNVKEEDNISNKEKYVLLKFIINVFLLIILSILLTISADNITRIYPNIASSSVGAILLGITTSLPEVVTTFSLIKLNNYNMAISNIIGSNIFNFLVLSISDFFDKKSIYILIDIYSKMYLFGGLFITILLLISLKLKNKYISTILSIITSISYLLVWYFQFK